MKKSILKTLNDVKNWFIFPYPIISFDTETTSLDYMTQELVGISFCSGTDSCYIDIIDNPEQEQILVFLREVFTKFTILIAHNISYDLKVLRKYDIQPREACRLFCTLTAAHLLNENLPKSLTFLAKKYFHIDLKSWNEVKNHGWHSEAFHSYGLTDAIIAYDLFRIQSPLLKLENLDDLFYNIEMPLQRVIVDLETDGILIDQDKLEQLQIELKGIVEDLKIKMCKSAGVDWFKQESFDFGDYEIVTGINFNSSKQLAKLITKKLGIKIETKTDKGELSTGVESLNKLKGKHPFIDLLRTYKKANILYNSYVKSFPEYIDSDGRIRCNWCDTVAVTGRLTSSNPGLAKLPRHTDEIEIPFDFRSCFVAPKGKKIVCCDYAGQELCWLGEVTQDKNLIEALTNGKDLHLTTAKQIFKLPIPDQCLYTDHHDYEKFKKRYKEQRHIGKNGVNFPLIYGKTAFGIAKDFNISQKEAQGWLDAFFSLYPDVKKAIAACHKEIDETGQVINWFGRIRRLDMTDKYGAYRQGFNFLVQGPSAEQLKTAAIRIKDLFSISKFTIGTTEDLDAKIILMVYDEIVYEIKEEYVEQSIKMVKSMMENCIKTSVPFTVDVGIGDNYGEAK